MKFMRMINCRINNLSIMPYNEIFLCLTSERDGHLLLLSGFSNDPVCLHIVDLKRVKFFPFNRHLLQIITVFPIISFLLFLNANKDKMLTAYSDVLLHKNYCEAVKLVYLC
jgi:hypothetical protein